MVTVNRASFDSETVIYHDVVIAKQKEKEIQKKKLKHLEKLEKLEKRAAKVKAVLANKPSELTPKAKARILFTKAEVEEISGLAIKEAIRASKDVGVKLKKKDLQGYVSSHLVLQVVDKASKTLIEEGAALEAELVAGGVAGKILEQMAADTGKDELLSACLIASSRAILKSNAKQGVKEKVAAGVVEVIAAGLVGRKVDLPSSAEAVNAIVAEGRLSIDPVLVAAMKDLEEGTLELSEDEELKLRLKARMAGIEVVEAEEPSAQEVEPTKEASSAEVEVDEVVEAADAPTLVPGSFRML